MRRLRLVPGGAPPLRVIPGGAEAPPELPARDGHAPGADQQTRPADTPAARPPRPATARRRARSWRRVVAAALALAVLAGLVVTGRVLAERPGTGPSPTAPATSATPSPGTPERPSPLVATVETGGFFSAMTTGGGSLWVAGSDQVTRIDPATDTVTATIPVGATGSGPAGVAYAGGTVWVPVAVPGTLVGIDPQRNKVTARIPLGEPLREPISLSATRGAVWIACCGRSDSDTPASGGTLLRVDPRRERVVAVVPLPARPMAVAADSAGAWVETGGGRVLTVSARRNRIVADIDAGGRLGFGQTIAVGAGAVWLADPLGEQVVRIDPDTRRVTARIPVGAATALAVSGDAVWVISSLGLVRVDPAMDRVAGVASEPELRRARLVAAGGGAVWTAGWNSVTRIDPDLVVP